MSYKGKFSNVHIRAGGTGFLIANLLNLVNNNDKYIIKYLLPDFSFTDYTNSYDGMFNLHKLFDMSLKYIYKNYDKKYFHLIKMFPVDYIYDVIKPTVKIRFISKEYREVYFRQDFDNDIQMRNINCTHLFNPSVEDNLILIDYDKGNLNKSTLHSLYTFILNNNIKFKTVFINTKPNNLSNFKNLLKYFKQCDTIVIFQLNEFEFTPIEKQLFSNEYYFSFIIVTRGNKPIRLYFSSGEFIEIPVNTELDNLIETTSGAGDIFFACVIYHYLYYKNTVIDSIKHAIELMPDKILKLNNDLFD